jgi:hypothetical protein
MLISSNSNGLISNAGKGAGASAFAKAGDTAALTPAKALACRNCRRWGNSQSMTAFFIGLKLSPVSQFSHSETGIIGHCWGRLVKLGVGRTACRKLLRCGTSASLRAGETVLRNERAKTKYLRKWARWSRCRLSSCPKGAGCAGYFASSFFRIRRSSMKQSPEVVQRTQPIMMITFMSIRAGSFPACALQRLLTSLRPEVHTPKDTAKPSHLLLPF